MKMGASAGAGVSAGLGIVQNFAEAVSAYHDGNADGVMSAAYKAGDHALAASLTAILKVPITVTLFEVRTLNRSPMTCSYIETVFLLAHIFTDRCVHFLSYMCPSSPTSGPRTRASSLDQQTRRLLARRLVSG